MAKRSKRGVTNPKDLRTVRKQIDARHKTPMKKLGTVAVREYAWTPVLDNKLCLFVEQHGRRGIKLASVALEWPFHIVKRRAKWLGLLNRSAPATTGVTRCKHGTVLTDDCACEQCLAELEQQIADAPPAPAAAKREKKLILVTCPHGDARLEILHRGKRGFTIVSGADPEQTYGAGPRGYPICPQHDVEMIAAEPIAAAEAFRQVQGATAPAVEQAALFDTAKPYNADGALVALEDLRQQIFAMREIVAGDKKQLTKHQKDLEVLEESLYAGLEEFMKRRRAKQTAIAEQQDRAELKTTGACSFERNTGKACPLCDSPSRALAVAAVDGTITAFTDIESEAHRAAALKANSIEPARLRDTAPALVAKALQIAGLYGVPVDVVMTWTDEERLAVLSWLEMFGPAPFSEDGAGPPPAALGMPHIAAEPGAEAQHCSACGAELAHMRDQDEAVTFFPEDALVGQFCPRQSVATKPESALSSHAG